MFNCALLVLLAVGLVSCGDKGTGPSPLEQAQAQTDREILVALYHATDGPNWKSQGNWLTSNDLSTWHGVTVANLTVVSRV